MSTKKNTSTTRDGEDDLSDVPAAELDAAQNAPLTRRNPKTEVAPEVRGEHVPFQNFREAVHQSPVTRVEEDLGIGVRDPYPTGNPRPQADIDHEVRGLPLTREDDDNDQGNDEVKASRKAKR